MMNRFKKGELVIINGIGKNTGEEYSNVLGIIEEKDYYFVQYKVNIMFDNFDWFHEKDLKRVFEKEYKKVLKYKVCLASTEDGLDFILKRMQAMKNKTIDLFKQADIFQKYTTNNKQYFYVIWSNTYWPDNNSTVKAIKESLPILRKMNIPYQFITLGITEKDDIKIDEFIKNDRNVDIFEVSTNIKIKKIGGII